MPQEGDDAHSALNLDSGKDQASAHHDAHGASRSILSAPIIALTRLTLRFPMATLAIAVGLAVFCGVLTATRLNYKSSRLDLLNPKSDYNRLWIEYIDEFGDEDDAVIVVEGESRDRVVPVLVELSATLSQEKRLFHAILHEVDLTKIRAKGLHYLSAEELQKVNGFLSGALAIAGGEWSQLQVGKLATGYVQQLVAANHGVQGLDATAALQQLEALTDGLVAAFSPTQRYQSPWLGMPASLSTLSELGTEYLVAREGKLGFVLLRLTVGKDEFARGNEAIDALRQLIAQTCARHPEVKIGLTGLPIMENDEMRASQSSMLWASLLSFGGVVLVIVAGFGGVRHAVMANTVLLIGMAWSFGYVTLTVGHLNILSVTFTVTLIGIGIDYGTYYVSRYMQYRRAGMECEESLVETTRTVGASIATGAITTAVAFFAAGLTRFVGVAELGIIAGGGILLCCVAQLFVLPALIHVVDHTRFGVSNPVPLPIHSWINPLLKVPRLMILGGAVATVITGIGMKELWYDHNLLNMQPQGLESVELERKLLSECDQSMWYALSIAESRDELLARKANFLKLPSVERTEEIVSLLPSDQEAKQQIIANIGKRLADLAERPPTVAIDPIDELGATLAQAQQAALQNPAGTACARRLELLRDTLRRLPAAECYAKISQFQQQMAGELLSRLHALRSVANPAPPELNDLPQSLVNRFVGKNNKHLLKIYGRGNIWDMEALGKFVHEVRSVDPRATGNPLQAYEASLEMKQSFEQAAIYALLVIVAVLYLDFRNFTHCVLAALPLVMGLITTFGLLGFLGQPLNPANLIALPLLLGIGIDYGVHIVHEYLEQSGRYRMSQATAVAVLVDALTTIIGFGSLMIASHRGLQSLGRVLTLGVTACTLASLLCLPAFLSWLTRKKPLVPWVGDAVESYDHQTESVEISNDGSMIPTRRAA